MVLGLSLPVFALLHVILSLVGSFAGLVVAGGFMSGKLLRGWTGLFLVTTILTNATGFLFPFAKILPSHILGGLSLVLFPFALFALYGKHLQGGWRKTFVAVRHHPHHHPRHLRLARPRRREWLPPASNVILSAPLSS